MCPKSETCQCKLIYLLFFYSYRIESLLCFLFITIFSTRLHSSRWCVKIVIWLFLVHIFHLFYRILFLSIKAHDSYRISRQWVQNPKTLHAIYTLFHFEKKNNCKINESNKKYQNNIIAHEILFITDHWASQHIGL